MSKYAVPGLAIHPDGRTFLSAGNECVTGTWPAAGASSNWRAGRNQASVCRHASFCPTASAQSWGEGDERARLVDVDAGEVLDMIGHTVYQTALALAPDAKKVLAGFNDKTLFLWDLDTKQTRQVGEHADTVLDVTFGPDRQDGLFQRHRQRFPLGPDHPAENSRWADRPRISRVAWRSAPMVVCWRCAAASSPVCCFWTRQRCKAREAGAESSAPPRVFRATGNCWQSCAAIRKPQVLRLPATQAASGISLARARAEHHRGLLARSHASVRARHNLRVSSAQDRRRASPTGLAAFTA